MSLLWMWRPGRMLEDGTGFRLFLVDADGRDNRHPRGGDSRGRTDGGFLRSEIRQRTLAARFLKYGEVTSVPVYADGLVYVSADSANLSAIDVKTRKIVWKSGFLRPGVSTPLLHEGLLYIGTDDGTLACFDAKTGEELWAEVADHGFYSSPILADGRVHLLDRGGTMHILKPGRELEILGKSVLGEEASCTPAVVGDSLYIRGLKHLFRIGP